MIEDEQVIRNIMKAFLEDAGYKVVLADDGVDGIEKFYKCNPDLVLLDLMLPKADGFTVCEIIRKESRVPIIMLTALDDDDSQMKGFDALADDYITKPFSMPLVVRRIEAVFHRTDGQAQDLTVIQYKNIRRKLGVDCIETIRGVGYKIEKENERKYRGKDLSGDVPAAVCMLHSDL